MPTASPQPPRPRASPTRVRTRPFLQAQATECPVAALGIVLDFYGRHVSLEELRRVSGVSRDCLNAAEMLEAARELGLQGRGRRVETPDFERLRFPLIAHLRFIHFVVVEGIENGRVLLNDPACGRHDMAIDEFDERFTGIVLELQPGPAFAPGGRPASPVSWFARHLRGRFDAVGVLAGTSLLLGAAPIAMALLLADLVDAAASAGATTAARRAAPALLALAAAVGALAWARDRGFASVDDGLSARCARVLDHLLTLPYAFFVYRLPRDLMQVVLGPQAVGRGVSGEFARATCDAAAAVLIAAAMVAIDPPLGLAIAVLGAALLACGRRLVRNGARRYASSQGLFGLSEVRFERMEMYHTGGLDDEYLAELCSHDARARASRQRYEESRAVARQVFAVGRGLAAASILGWGAHQVAARALYPGAVVALLLLGDMLLRRAQAVLADEGELDDIRADVTGQAETESIPPEEVAAMPTPAEASTPRRGALALRDVSFGYSRKRRPVVEGVSLVLEPGDQLGLSGPSGAGKSTLASLAAGLHQPWSGHVEWGGVPLAGLGPDERARWIGWIGKPVLFEGSLRDNVTLWDPAADDEQVARALCDVGLGEWVAERTGGLGARVELRGRNLSAGQRQRLEIARALLRPPAVLVLDEALDAIEPELESVIRDRLRARGCALLLTSGRESTLAACDRVLRIERGRLPHDDEALPVAAPATPMHGAMPGGDWFGTPTPDSGAVGDLDARLVALHSVAAAQGLRFALDEARLGGPADLPTLCRRGGLRSRRVRLAPSSWWRTDCGPLLGFLRRNGQPVLLEPGDGHYDRVEPSDGSRVRVDAANAAVLESHAFALYGPLSEPATPERLLGQVAGSVETARDVATAAIAAVAIGSLALAPPLATLLFIGAPDSGGVAGSALLLAGVAAALFGLAHELAVCRARGRVEHAALAATWDRLVRLPASFLRRQGPPDLAARCHGIPRALALLGDAPVVEASTAGASLATLLLLIAWLEPSLAALAAVTFAAPLPVALLVASRAARQQAARLECGAAQRGLLFDMLRGMARLRAAGAERRLAGAWQRAFEASLALDRHARALRRPWRALVELYPFLAAAALPAAIGLGIAAPLSLPEVCALVLAFHTGSHAALAVAGGAAAALEARAWLDRVRPLLLAPLEATSQVPAPPLRGAVEARDLCFRYPGAAQPALDSVSLRVEPGELVALTGPSGGGKSTLVRVLLGLEQAQRGCVEYDGHRMGEVDPRSLRAQLGAVLQEDTLATATLRLNIAGSSAYGLDEVWQAARRARIAADIQAFPMGIQTLAEDGLLSSGQKQRVLIAARLLRRPRVLFLDEATSAVPEALEAEILAEIRALGITCIYVAHRASAVRQADRVYVVERGKVVHHGSPAALPGSAPLPRRATEAEEASS